MMDYDNYDFDIDRVIEHSKSIKKKDERIQYLKKVRKEYQDKLTDEGQPSFYCDSFEDTTKPEGGKDDKFIAKIFNEIKLIEIQKDKYIRKPARLDEILPNTIYPRKTIAELGGCSLSAIEKWVTFGKKDANGNTVFLETTDYLGESRILGRHFLEFIKKTSKTED